MDNRRIVLSVEGRERYLNALREQGRAESTLQTYERSLRKLSEYLGDSALEKGSLENWRDWMLEMGYLPNTINMSLSIANGYLDFAGRRDLQLVEHVPVQEGGRPSLTRGEYLEMLRAARAQGKEKVYLLIKVFATTGICVQELPCVTAEAVEKGFARIGRGAQARTVCFTDGLRQELRDYCVKRGIATGPVFKSRAGEAVRRTAVTDSIRIFCKQAGLDAEKGNPRCLRQLYLATQDEIHRRLEARARREYEKLLEAEQRETAWNTQREYAQSII